MTSHSMIGQVIVAFVGQIPLLIVWIGGIVLALARWRRHPMVSLMAVAGLAVVLIAALINVYSSMVLPRAMADAGKPIPEVVTSMQIRYLVNYLVSSVGWALVVGAVFAGRAKQETRSAEKQ